MCVWSVWCQKLMLAHLVAFRSGLWWQTTGDEGESSALQFSKVPMEHLRPATACVSLFCIFWWCVSPVFLQAGPTDRCGFCFKVYLSLEHGMKTNEFGRCCQLAFTILVWYMSVPAAPSVYTVWGDKPLSSALCVCDCSPIAVHILCLWTQTEFSRCTYITSKEVCFQRGDTKSSARRMENFLSSVCLSHVSVRNGVRTLTKVRLARWWTIGFVHYTFFTLISICHKRF